MMKVNELISLMEELAPVSLACEWDNVGLQVGSREQQVEKVLLTLDITEGVVEEAMKYDCQMIISHHPLLFNPLKRVTEQDMTGRIVLKAVQNGISIYSAHTNLDKARGGLNDYLAGLMGIKNPRPFGGGEENLYKLVVFIPEDNYQEVRAAVFSAGAGYIGNYSHTSFSVNGQGTFKPLAGSNPYLGEKGELNQVAEIRLETIVPADKLAEVVQAMLTTHPYEEVAYDIYQLVNQQEKLSPGRIGELEEEKPLEQYLREIKQKLQLPVLKYTGQPDRQIGRVAVGSGSAAGLIEDARQAGADLYLTGDVKYHQVQRAEELGLVLVDAGHYYTECIVKGLLQDYLQERAADIKFIKSGLKTGPWKFYRE